MLRQVSTKGRRRYSCKCECGDITEVSANNLKGGKVISCGCALKGCNRRRPYEWLYSGMVASSKERGLTLDITYDDFAEFTKIEVCHYCTGRVWWNPHSTDHMRGEHTRSYNLDRKDSSLGYLKNNIVVCCTRCNRAKNNLFTYEEWVEIGKVIAEFGKKNG